MLESLNENEEVMNIIMAKPNPYNLGTGLGVQINLCFQLISQSLQVLALSCHCCL